MVNMQTGDGCSCDPAIYTSDCTSTPCVPFFSVFLSFQNLILISYVVLIIISEYKRKGNDNALWRIMLAAGLIGTLAKVLRLGLLANPDTRHTAGQVGLLFLYNTHMSFGFLCYLTLLFFWARLYHDLVPTKEIFGKLFPIYIFFVAFIFVFFYGQVVALAVTGINYWFFPLFGGLVFLIFGITFDVYAVILWKNFVAKLDKNTLFYRLYMSAIMSSILLVFFIIELAISNLTHFNTTNQFLVKHSIYETLFVAIYVALPSGFLIHYFHTWWKPNYLSSRESTSSKSVSMSVKEGSRQSWAPQVDLTSSTQSLPTLTPEDQSV